MIDHVVAACREAGVDALSVVISPAQRAVAEHLAGRCELVYQPEPDGTGGALRQVPAAALGSGDVLVLSGDAPLVRAATVRRLLAEHREAGAAATLAVVQDPGRDDGRVIRAADGSLDRIVEARDATPAERQVTEFNVGLYCFDAPQLAEALKRLTTDNEAREQYLTQVFDFLRPARLVTLNDPAEAAGVNDRVQLAAAESHLRGRLLRALMLGGVTVTDPATTFVDAGVEVGQDTVLEPFTVLRGATVVGAGCRIGPHTEIRDSRVGDGARIEHSWLHGVEFGAGSDCGPYSKLRPGTRIAAGVHIGSFAELTRTTVGSGSRVPHMSYLGDTTVGEGVNIGAGSITANYDGRHKHPTVIEDGAFVGVSSMLVGPVRLGRGSRTGAGSVVTRDVPDGATVVGVPARVIRRQPEGELQGP